MYAVMVPVDDRLVCFIYQVHSSTCTFHPTFDNHILADEVVSAQLTQLDKRCPFWVKLRIVKNDQHK